MTNHTTPPSPAPVAKVSKAGDGYPQAETLAVAEGNAAGSWSVFNSGGACIIENVTFGVAADYMTPGRFARGWTMVSVINTQANLEAEESRAAPVAQAAAGESAVTDAMVTAYLEANDAYWRKTDHLPVPPDKWRTGSALEATRFSLIAALSPRPEADADSATPTIKD